MYPISLLMFIFIKQILLNKYNVPSALRGTSDITEREMQ